jgi:hypothetical protein
MVTPSARERGVQGSALCRSDSAMRWTSAQVIAKWHDGTNPARVAPRARSHLHFNPKVGALC